MKKLALFAAVAASLGVMSAASAQTDSATATTRRTTHKATAKTSDNVDLTRRLRRIEASAHSFTATTPAAARVDGSVTRTVRSGNPLQMINPFAPKEYGDGRDVTNREPDDAYQRPEGLKLFAVDF